MPLKDPGSDRGNTARPARGHRRGREIVVELSDRHTMEDKQS